MTTVSDITVAALTATPTLRGNKLAWTYSDPRSGALPNIALDMVEVWASTTNDRTGAAKVGEGITDFTHSGLVEEQTWYYWIKARDFLPAAQGGPGYGAFYPSSTTAGISAKAVGLSGLGFGFANLQIVPSVAANALTVAVKTSAGADASASDSIFVAFRDTASATGGFVIRQLAAGLSVVYPDAGAMAPAVNDYPFRIWILLFDDGGTFRIALSNRSGSNTVASLPTEGIATSVSSGTNLQIITPGVTITAKPFRVIGYMDWSSGLPTARSFSIGPDVTRLFGPGVPLPGSILQQNYKEAPSSGSLGTTTVPYDDTIPQRSEGNTHLNISITPASRCNILIHEFSVFVATSSGADPIVASLHYQSGYGGTDALASAIGTPPAANVPVEIYLKYAEQGISSTAAIGYQVNVGGTVAGTISVNGVSAARKLGGALNSFYRSQEIMG